MEDASGSPSLVKVNRVRNPLAVPQYFPDLVHALLLIVCYAETSSCVLIIFI